MSDKKTNTEKFVEFHNANPAVYRLLVESCRKYMKATGNEKWGIAPAMERVRWVLSVDTNDSDGEFKLNAIYAAFFARLIMDREGDLKDIFDIRSAEADLDGSWYEECN